MTQTKFLVLSFSSCLLIACGGESTENSGPTPTPSAAITATATAIPTATATAIPTATATAIPTATATATATATPTPTALATTGVFIGQEAYPDAPELVWSEEFDGPELDPEVWNITTGNGASGWGNQELQYYSRGNNITFEFDELADSNVIIIEARNEEINARCWYGIPCDYSSSRIDTEEKVSFQWGRIEARIRLPRSEGLWPAFWMLGDRYTCCDGWPGGGEIDIMEQWRTNNSTHGTVHGPGYSGGGGLTEDIVHTDFNIEDGYHIYAIEWDDFEIRWFFDDVEFFQVSRLRVRQVGEWVYSDPFWVILNIAVGGTLGGDNVPPVLSERMYVDYVRVYQ